MGASNRGVAMWLLAAALGIALVACKHDLDKLRADYNGGLRDSGKPSQLDPDTGTDAGTNTGTTPAGMVCEPCDPVADAGPMLGLRSCCRGPSGRECGLTFADGSLCLPHKAPGQPNSACPAVRQGMAMFEGCCRVDGRCGIVADQFDLGCVARDEILPRLGVLKADPIACGYTCSIDADCGAAAGGFVCTEDQKDPTHKRRICINDCVRDTQCPRDQICALANDLSTDRVLALCQPPLGTLEPGQPCAVAGDCVHGVCLQLDMGTPKCSKLCSTTADCPAKNSCIASMIDTPSKKSSVTFHICKP